MNKLNNADTLRFRVAEFRAGRWRVTEGSFYETFEDAGISDVEDIPDTVDIARFTGLHDGAGVEIWEGDLLGYGGVEPTPIIYRFGAFGIEDPFETFISFAQRESNGNLAGFLSRARVVGNVWHGVTKKEEEA